MRNVFRFAVIAWVLACITVLLAHVEPATTEPEPEPAPVVIVVPAEEPDLAPITVVTYPVPMDQEMQDFIIQLCEEHHIEPGIVFAVIDHESDFRTDVIGDSGRSYGLMQIQPRWHEDRMERLGCDDLLDPRQNVTVGVDYLSELFERGNGVEWALAAYNAGPSGANKGYGSAYAEAILRNSEALAEEVTVNVYYH